MSHGAKFSDPILEAALGMLDERLSLEAVAQMADSGETDVYVLDPFAGTGKGVDFLRSRGYDARGIDLEPADAWGDAIVSPYVELGNALDLDVADGSVDVVFTSPTYGNRFADRDMRPSVAGTYMKSLGREASEGSSCHMQWGPAYREFHAAAWAEVRRVLRKPASAIERNGGLFLLNISDHYRDRQPVGVAAWHVKAICALGFEWVDARSVSTDRLTRGANPTRCEVEWLMLFRLVSP